MDLRKQLGKMGEIRAANYLEEKGYKVIETNYRCKTGELDIIVLDNETLVAVEVKTRRNLAYGLPCQSITLGKRDRIKKTLKYYLLVNKIDDMDMRIDVIEILATDAGSYINHIIDAI